MPDNETPRQRAERLAREAHRQVLICAAIASGVERRSPADGEAQQAALGPAHKAIDAALEAEREAALCEGLQRGIEEGLRRYAWWKDGTEYVGSCGTTLKQALADAQDYGRALGRKP